MALLNCWSAKSRTFTGIGSPFRLPFPAVLEDADQLLLIYADQRLAVGDMRSYLR
jgi:hypothetical protein